MTEKVYIVAAKRTPIGSFLGGLSSQSAVELASLTIKSALAQAELAPTMIDEVVVGNVLGAGLGQGVGRQAAIHAEIPVTTPAYTLNMICGSGMKSILNAINSVRSGDANLVVAAGTESMSNAPFVMDGKCRQGNKMGDISMIDTMLKDGLTDAFGSFHMGITAENIAKRHEISRGEQDAFALRSQSRAEQAIKSGCFEQEIVPVVIKSRKGESAVNLDEHPRFGTTIESLSGLRAAFDKQGSVTAGNASGLNDGAVALIVASEQAVQQHGLAPLVEVVATGQGGVEPDVMGLGPVPAVKQALQRAELELSDIQRLELNEAFASQAIGVMKGLSEQHQVPYDWFEDKTNVNGGAIALGHPIGASGGRIVTTLIYEMIRSKTQLGLASLCIGGGMGTALILKRVS
ncbi:acetyl-CoA C-acetyltransferase [Vibrio tubiashii]|uniref:acetyl-CoA C-acetyltransferase n=1 Tax=Vibrio tubiashii TaxID=29498 RepID=UPI001EFEC5FD|nr:acetyl-CoA C-acetyltransferase [Vibrio tubiashii]MCG9580269.1 acetyl-CoA C-acetyltransferase [Vibrio tubiashii]MCG9613860.1 acetyl-CoA C-acetyltransferase [Vibrio tubiashii]MCG9686837.1 acetyl-CoA C-acetyltransferase [Vibrio tubiashii]